MCLSISSSSSIYTRKAMCTSPIHISNSSHLCPPSLIPSTLSYPTSYASPNLHLYPSHNSHPYPLSQLLLPPLPHPIHLPIPPHYSLPHHAHRPPLHHQTHHFKKRVRRRHRRVLCVSIVRRRYFDYVGCYKIDAF